MQLKDKVSLNVQKQLRLFFYNEDSGFKDHEVLDVAGSSSFVIVGYVLEKSNKIFYEYSDAAPFAYVLMSQLNNELFRVKPEIMDDSFSLIKLN